MEERMRAGVRDSEERGNDSAEYMRAIPLFPMSSRQICLRRRLCPRPAVRIAAKNWVKREGRWVDASRPGRWVAESAVLLGERWLPGRRAGGVEAGGKVLRPLREEAWATRPLTRGGGGLNMGGEVVGPGGAARCT